MQSMTTQYYRFKPWNIGRYFIWSLFAIALIVFGVLAWNVLLTQRARARRSRLESFALHLRAGPEFKVRTP